MLDDTNLLAQFDRSNGVAVVAGQAEQLRQQYEFDAPVLDGIQNVVLAGMGGSALAAEFIKSWLGDRLEMPFEIVRGYDIPKYVGKNTLLILSSYSGNTEETISCFTQAKNSSAAIVVMSSGGKLAEGADEYSYLQIPGGCQPRLAVLYGVKALASLFEQMGLIDGVIDDLETNAEWLLSEVENFTSNIKEANNPAKQIAKQLTGHPVVVYGGPTLEMVAMKWKIDINENGKHIAFWNRLPEFNHNEFIGWHNPKDNNFRVIELTSSLDNDRIEKRFEVSNRLLSGKMPAPIVVEAHGETKLQQMLWTLLLGDFVSVYLAVLNQTDPIPVELIEKLKKELG